MKLKGYHRFINENFKPIDVDAANESADSVGMTDIEWFNVCKQEFPGEEERILKSINTLKWEPMQPGKSVSAGQGFAIKNFIKGFKVPKVDMIAYEGNPRNQWIFGTKDEPGAALTTYGVQGNYKNGTYRHYFIDRGNDLVPVGSQLMKEPAAVTEAKKTARTHPVYAAVERYLKNFPDNATNWSQATDEVRDLARTAREIYTELDLDMLHDEWETNPKAPQPLDFRKLKTPAEWNKQGKKYVYDTLDKMSDHAKDAMLDHYYLNDVMESVSIDESLSSLTSNEKKVLDEIKKKTGAVVTKATRNSDQEGDVNIDGKTESIAFTAWLPLKAIRELLDWTDGSIADRMDYPDMARSGDWSGVRDTDRDVLMQIYRENFVDKK